MDDVLVSLDLEMTSVRAESQEVVEIAAIKFRGERVLETWSRLIRPKARLPYNVQVLTGIRPEDLARAPALPDVAEQLVAFLGRLPLVGHTVSADVGCLQRQGVALDNPQIDTFELASVLLPRMPSYSLAALVRHFEIPFPTQHRAMADALVTKQLYMALLRLASDLDVSILQEISRLVAPFDWPLKAIFSQAEAKRVSTATAGASIRQQLLAKAAGDDLPLEVLLLAPPSEEPLRPTGDRRLIDATRLTLSSEVGGPLGRSIPDPGPERAQGKMFQAVARTLNGGGYLVVEAGPGIGRSQAYLLPAIELATMNGERAVVAAGTPALLEQLWERDLPDSQRSLPTPFRMALVKPRESYLCLCQWSALRHRRDLTLAEALTLVKTLVWLPTTRTGDVAELNLTEAERGIWQRTSAGELCSPRTCQHARRGTCFLGRVQQAAASAHVVVTSHAALLSDTAGPTGLLPDGRHLVVDEAHRLEDEATSRLGRAVRAREARARLEELVGVTGLLAEITGQLGVARGPAAARPDAAAAGQAVVEAAEAAILTAAEFFASLARFAREAGGEGRGHEPRVRLTRGARARPSWKDNVVPASEAFAASLAGVEAALAELLRRVEIPLVGRARDGEALLARLRSLHASATRFRAEVSEAIAGADDGQVRWISIGGEDDVGLCAAPIRVGEILARRLWSPRESVVVTSSTLSVGGSFDYLKGRLGLDGAEEASLAPPFDLTRSLLLYLPNDVPEPEQRDYQECLQRTLVDLCSATLGRTLVLFTSHSQLRQTWRGINEQLAARGILTLGQGVDGSPRRQLVQTFKTNARTVLLATGSFWEAVDLPDEALSVLVIARLPFPPPGDPVVAARSEGLRDPLLEYSLPATILRFRQGFGRLIRSPSDRGLVLAFDRRLQTKSYGSAFLKSLPQCEVRSGPVTELPEQAVRWLGAREPG